jgi:hypothetical protein
MWVIIAREYNEDPVIETMLPPPGCRASGRSWCSSTEARPRESKLAVARYDVGKAIQGTWNPEEVPGSVGAPRQVIEEGSRRPSPSTARGSSPRGRPDDPSSTLFSSPAPEVRGARRLW